jgi:hypothetical protein
MVCLLTVSRKNIIVSSAHRGVPVSMFNTELFSDIILINVSLINDLGANILLIFSNLS